MYAHDASPSWPSRSGPCLRPAIVLGTALLRRGHDVTVATGERWAPYVAPVAFGAVYVFADFCSGEVWGLGRDSAGRLVNALLLDHPGNISSFGVDVRYELYATGYEGTLYKFEAAPR